MFSIIMTLFGKEVLKENYLEAASKVVVDFVEKILNIKKFHYNSDVSRQSLHNTRFLNHLLNKLESNFDYKSILDETQTMLIGSTESFSLQISTILINLGKFRINESMFNDTCKFRHTSEDIELDDYTIPAGTNIVIPISLMHRLPKYWKNPDKFNPDRFLSKKVLDLPSCVYMPFTYGCRNCIGYKYGVLNMKVMLRTLLRHYKFESVDYISIEEF